MFAGLLLKLGMLTILIVLFWCYELCYVVLLVCIAPFCVCVVLVCIGCAYLLRCGLLFRLLLVF